MVSILDQAFEYLIDKDKLKGSAQKKLRAEIGWQNNHIAPHDRLYNRITREEAIALKDYVKQQIIANKEKALAIQPATKSIEQADFDRYLTTGTPPDDVVRMQIDQSAGFTEGHPDGMNIEAMLKEMHAITTEDKAFDLNSNNCSVTVGRILAAGAKGEHLKAQFENRALGAIGNPQKVLNNALRYLDAMKNPKDSFIKKMTRTNPLKAAKGWCTKTLFVDKKASTEKKVLAGIAAVPIAIAQGTITGLKKMATPVKSLNELVNFNRYAQSRPSLGFKIGAAVVSAPAFAVLAIPAAISAATSKAYSAFGSLSKSFSKQRQSHLSDNVDLEHAAISKGLTIEKNLQSALNDTIIIKANNLKEALLQFKKALDTQNGPVVLDKQTEKAVIKQIRKIKDPAKQEATLKEYDALCQQSIARIIAIQQSILVAETAQNPDASQPSQPLPPAAPQPDDLILVQPAQFTMQQQFYSVMPILGMELAQQIDSYSDYEPPIMQSQTDQNSSGLPKTVNAAAVASNDGYLASKTERDYIIDFFHKNPDAKELRNAIFPDDHPLKGQPICEAFKDNHGNIYVMNEAILGKGGFGTVKVIQAIETPNPDQGVVAKEFYVVKIQDVDNEDPDRTLNAIQGEMNVSAQFGLHLGQMIIEHEVLKQLPKYELQSSAAASAPLQTQKTESSTSAQPPEIEAAAFVPKEDAVSFVPEDDAASFVIKDDAASFVIKDDTATFVPQEESTLPASTEEQPTAAGFWALYKSPPVQQPKVKEKHTLEYYADLQPAVANVDADQDLSSFDTLKFLNLFEKMTAQVEMVHAKGVLHRDIKAENFLYDPKKDEMRLIDFGCSKQISDPTISTPKKMCIGSAANFSPEHFHSDYKQNISTKQDIYALARTFTLLMAKDMLKLNPSAYKDGLPTPAVPSEIQEQITSSFMENFRFNNTNNDPRAKIINQMLDLMHEMMDMRVNNRPEASDVRLRLQGLINEYKLVVAAEKDKQDIATSNPQPVIQDAVTTPAPQRQPSLMEQNVKRNLYLLDKLASRHPDSQLLINYAKQGISDAHDVDQAMSRLLSELSKSKTPKNPKEFTADLVRTFEQMKKTPPAQVAALTQQNIAPVSSQSDANSDQARPLALTSRFESSRNHSQPMIANPDKVALSKQVEANLHKLDELAQRFYVDGDTSKVPALVKYFKGELKGSPNVDATMSRLLNEMVDDKRFKSKDESPSFKEALKEIFNEMKKSPKNSEDKESAVAIRIT